MPGIAQKTIPKILLQHREMALPMEIYLSNRYKS
jgi:hypothetical protein